jgi:hypothetical protein
MVVMVSTVSSDSGTSAMKFSSEPDPSVTDAEGRYSLRGVEPNIELEVRADGSGLVGDQTEPLTLTPNQKKTGVDLTLAAAGSVHVILDGLSGMHLVNARYLGDQPGVSDTNQVVPAAEATLDGLVPGRWEISLQKLGVPDPAAILPAPQEVEVHADQTEPVTFSL